MFSVFTRVRPTRATLAAAAASALVPALLLATTGPAVAAANTLTITAINRAGAKAAVTATVISLAGNQEYRIRTGTKRKLPKGNYAVLASIRTGGTTTLGGKTVKVAGNAKLTVDARHGRAINLALNPATGLSRTISAQICSNTGGGANAEIDAWGDDSNPIFVIPTASKKIAFAALGTWTDSSSLTDSYAALHRTVGVPGNPARTFNRAQLGTVTVESRRGPSASESSGVSAQPTITGCGSYLSSYLWNAVTPHTAKVHLSPGDWEITGGGPTGHFTATRRIAAARPYYVRFFAAVLGPGIYLPTTYQGRIIYPVDDMFQDAAFPGPNGNRGDETTHRATATLKLGGKTVKTAYDRGGGQYLPSLEYRVKKAGWYTLTNTATRYAPESLVPADMLSTASSVTYRFHAKPKTSLLSPNYSVQHVPAGLNGHNRAVPGSTTNVAIKLGRTNTWGDVKRGANPTLRSLTTQISTDGGRTWRHVPVRKIGGTWTAVVPNPASGAVSLRTRATCTSGGYTEATVFRAYAVG